MERYDDQIDRAKFDAVWQRVMGGAEDNGPVQKQKYQCAEPHEAEVIRGFMDGEACDAQFYGMLAGRCSGMARQMLRRISADEMCHLRRLRARYFILTGKTYKPPDACPLICGAADALRKKYSGEKEGAEAYFNAAEHAEDQDLKDTYLANAQDEARHSKLIGRIIENMF